MIWNFTHHSIPNLLDNDVFLFTGQETCDDPCPAGYGCPSRNAAIQCTAGTFSTLQQESCEPCADGYYRTVLVSEGRVLRQFCFIQMSKRKTIMIDSIFLLLGASTCLPCPAGQECPTAASTPEDCLPGYVSALGESACTKCSNGNEIRKRISW